MKCSDRLGSAKEKTFTLTRCQGCGLVYLNPRPIGDYAESFYYEEGYDPFLSLKNPRSVIERIYAVARKLTLRWKRNRILHRVPPRGKVLDIGCGTGEFLDAISRDFEVVGIEPEPNVAKWARDRFGLTVFTGNLETVNLENGQFDLVTMWHVLEHVPDPTDELKRIHKILTPDGKLLLALPDICSFDARIYKSDWVALDAPRHLWHFTQDHVRKLASLTGFRLSSSGMLPLDTFYNSLMSEKTSLEMHGKHYILLTLARLPVAVVFSLVWGLITGKHSGMYYVLEKN